MTRKLYTTLNVEPRTYDILKKIAKKQHRTLISQTEMIVEEAAERLLRPDEIPPKPAPSLRDIGIANEDEVDGP